MADAPNQQNGNRPEWMGSILGVATFVLGVALLWMTFQWAYGVLTQTPAQTLGLKDGEAVDLNVAGRNFLGVLVKVMALVLMAGVGATIATRGVKLYMASREPVGKRPNQKAE